ncbi:hypothetical protein M7I_2928 [Glarea lozoyensis 74030]|uniref:GED domain-containing protein n=1 Tax=Glarea lozoyensis (strain ATCC 74030 / MF5533) TaxID=1104152 RepID=H0EK37_GLAL7|nr:hypothetical protein M7I_2928 [Glarea lozoyensis 74030]
MLLTLKDGMRPNVEDYSVSLAADVAAAYYKKPVSFSAYQMFHIFSPDVAWDLTDEQVDLLGSEDTRTVTERAELEKKLEILENGLSGLDAFTTRSGGRGV